MKFNNRNRQEFKEAELQIKALTEAEKRLQEENLRQYNINDRMDYTRYYRNKRYARRVKVVKVQAPDGRCSDCGTLVGINARDYVVPSLDGPTRAPGANRPVCRKCAKARRHHAISVFKNGEGPRLVENPFTPYALRFELDYSILIAARVVSGLTAAEFAAECGWTPQHQSALERGKTKTISEDTADIISEVLEEHKVIGKSPTKLINKIYNVHPVLCVAARTATGIQSADFANLAGWERQYQYHLEKGRIEKVSQRVPDRYEEVLRKFGIRMI